MPDIIAARPVAGQPIETAWGQQVHDAIEAEPLVQRGTVGVLVNSATPPVGTQLVTFPIPFSAVPTVVLTWGQGTSTGASQVTYSHTAASQFSFSATVVRTVGAGSITVNLDWIAIGPRA